jgi:hypothetical protein
MDIEKKRKEMELAKVRAARAELEFKIMEREQEIGRMKDHIALHDKKEEELIHELE